MSTYAAPPPVLEPSTLAPVATTTSPFRRALMLLGVVALFFVAFFGFVRPWYKHWGATVSEQHRALPGDEIIPDPIGQETRAITIRKGVGAVWPWVAQLGQDRGGFYSFDMLENLVGCEMPVGEALVPDKQAWAVGDKLWMYPPDKADGRGYATLRVYQPGRALGFAARSFGTPATAPPDGSWSFFLEPVNDSTTRMVVRGRGAGGRTLLGGAFDRAVFEPMHFVMERRMMIGIRQLAEGRSRNRVANDIQVVLWTITAALLVAAAIGTLRSTAWRRQLLGFVLAGIVFQLLTLRQPPLILSVPLVFILSAIVWWPEIPSPRRSNA